MVNLAIEYTNISIEITCGVKLVFTFSLNKRYFPLVKLLSRKK